MPRAIHFNLIKYKEILDIIEEFDSSLRNRSESEIKEFLIMSDTDFDGKITAKDARAALRIAAGLENKVEFSHDTDSFWSNI